MSNEQLVDDDRNEQPSLPDKRHPDCVELRCGCELTEYKGYPPCTGFCERSGEWL